MSIDDFETPATSCSRCGPIIDRQGQVRLAETRWFQLGARLVRRRARREARRRKAGAHVVGDKDRDLFFRRDVAGLLALANALRGLGAQRGDRLLLMLGASAPLWIALLAAIKLGLVVIPPLPLLPASDLADRLYARPRPASSSPMRPSAAKFDARGDALLARISVGGAPPGWRDGASSVRASPNFEPTRRPGRTIRCCSISPPARRRGRSW